MLKITFSLLTLFILVGITQASTITELPEKFLGTFKLVESRGFEDYLETKGLDWLKRKIICMTPVTYVFKKTEEPNRYIAEIFTSTQKVVYVDWALNEMFIGEGMDNTKHQITFYMNDKNILEERHYRFEVEGDNVELYHWSIKDGYLHQSMTNKGKTAQRWHKRIPDANGL